MDAVLLDLDGVIYQGDSALPGALASWEWLQRHDFPHLFLTNTTSRPAQAIVDRLIKLGIQADAKQLVTPAKVARHWLQEQGARRVAMLVPEPTLEDLSGFELLTYPQEGSVDALIVGDLAEEWSYDRLNWGFRMLLEAPDAHLIALGMTRYCRSGTALRLDVAPFVSALQCATDRQPLVAGKPGQLMFATALAILGVDAKQAAMWGDDIRSDVGGAQQAGLTGVLVKTGKFRPEDLAGEVQPDSVVGSIAELPDWIDSLHD